MSRYWESSVNRTICDVLTELRACYKTRNFAPFLGLLEEMQSMANRMEAALYDNSDWKRARSELKALEAEIKALQTEVEALESEKVNLKDGNE